MMLRVIDVVSWLPWGGAAAVVLSDSTPGAGAMRAKAGGKPAASAGLRLLMGVQVLACKGDSNLAGRGRLGGLHGRRVSMLNMVHLECAGMNGQPELKECSSKLYS